MSTTTTDSQAVGPVLWEQIEPFKPKLDTPAEATLNIIENPSVGTLVAPAEICELIGATLKTLLKASLDRGSTRVRVICTVDHSRHLTLEVADDAPWHDVLAQFQLSICAERAIPLGGITGIRYTTGGEVIAGIVVPLPSN